MSDEAQRFETEDMTFVTVLLIEGIHHTEMTKNNGGCRWVFVGSAAVIGKIIETLEEYNDDSCYVEARDFTRRIGAVRREMYQFLGHSSPRVRG
jgi:hypothetical protein